jgi:uncharacterized protein involved in high-affinity Fe2+ transport
MSKLARMSSRAVTALLTVGVAAMASGCDATKPDERASSSSMKPTAMSSSEMSAMSEAGAKGASMPKAMPIMPLASTAWEGMKIEARAMAPVPFVVVTGTSEKVVRPSTKDNMHLMVMLTDAETGVDLPYATVWATVRKGSKIVYDNRQWPMLSRYMGAHYGNDVALPGPGTYKLSLLIGPPQSARHMEYAKVWLRPHRVNMTFKWPASGAS